MRPVPCASPRECLSVRAPGKENRVKAPIKECVAVPGTLRPTKVSNFLPRTPATAQEMLDVSTHLDTFHLCVLEKVTHLIYHGTTLNTSNFGCSQKLSRVWLLLICPPLQSPSPPPSDTLFFVTSPLLRESQGTGA